MTGKRQGPSASLRCQQRAQFGIVLARRRSPEENLERGASLGDKHLQSVNRSQPVLASDPQQRRFKWSVHHIEYDRIGGILREVDWDRRISIHAHRRGIYDQVVAIPTVEGVTFTAGLRP